MTVNTGERVRERERGEGGRRGEMILLLILIFIFCLVLSVLYICLERSKAHGRERRKTKYSCLGERERKEMLRASSC